MNRILKKMGMPKSVAQMVSGLPDNVEPQIEHEYQDIMPDKVRVNEEQKSEPNLILYDPTAGETKKYVVFENCVQDDNQLAFPTPYKKHYVETDDIKSYILDNMTDCYGHKFKVAGADIRRIMDVDYTSHAGSIKVKEYNEPNFKK